MHHFDAEAGGSSFSKKILVKLVVGDLVLNVISVYAPQVGLDTSIKRQFCERLGMVRRVPTDEKLFIG